MLIALSLFFTSFLAATLLPLSSEVAFYATIESGLDPIVALLSASSGNILAIIFNYFLGYYLFKKTKKRLFQSKTGKKAFLLGHKYGLYSLFLSWLPIIGDPLTIVAGLVRLNFLHFLLIAATLRFGRYLFILYYLREV